MGMSQRSEQELGRLVAEGRLGAGKGATELADDRLARATLDTLIGWYIAGREGRGGEAAEDFLAEVRRLAETEGPGHEWRTGKDAETGPGCCWRVHKLVAENYRGLTEWNGGAFEYDFDGMPHHIYGPNASGKSCILSAIVWCLTGRCLRERSIPAEASGTTGLYGEPSDAASHLRGWPDVVTIPHEHTRAEMKGETPHCRVQVELGFGARSVVVTRALEEGQQVQTIAEGGTEHESLADLGIGPLDEEIALLLPARVGALHYGKGSKLSENLLAVSGLDALCQLGQLARLLGTNVSRREGEWRGDARRMLEGARKSVQAKLSHEDVPANVRDELRKTGQEVDRTADVSAAVLQATLWRLQAERADSLAEEQFAEAAHARELALEDEEHRWTREERDELAEQVDRALARIRDASATWEPLSSWSQLDADLGEVEEGAQQWATGVRRELAGMYALWQRNEELGGRLAVRIVAAHYLAHSGEYGKCPVCGKELPPDIQRELRELKGKRSIQKDAIAQYVSSEVSRLSSAILVDVAGLDVQAPAAQVGAMLGCELLAPIERLTGMHSATVVQVSALRQGLATYEEATAPESLLDAEWGADFRRLVEPLQDAYPEARCQMAVGAWVQAHQAEASAAAESLRQSVEDGLARVRKATGKYQVLRTLAEALEEAVDDCEGVRALEDKADHANQVRARLKGLAPLDEHAKQCLQDDLSDLASSMQQYYATLYPADPVRLGGLVNRETRAGSPADYSVTLEMADQVFADAELVANQGRIRGVLWAFAFAILDRQRPALETVIIDDPYISLDDYAAQNMLDQVLSQRLGQRWQFVATAHKEHFIRRTWGRDPNQDRVGVLRTLERDASHRRCRFVRGVNRLREAVDRYREDKEEFRRVNEQTRVYLEGNLRVLCGAVLGAHVAPQYCDDMVHRLSDAVQNRAGLSASGEKLKGPVRALLKSLGVDFRTRPYTISNSAVILHVPHHAEDEPDATPEHARVVAEQYAEWETRFRDCFDAMDRLAERVRDGVQQALDRVDPSDASLLPISRITVAHEVALLGRVAADGEVSVYADDAEERELFPWPDLGYSLVTEDVLRPVARAGQIAMLAPREIAVKSGDLAVIGWGDCAYVRRLHECALEDDEKGWTAQVISHHARHLAPVLRHQDDVTVRKLVGVLYTMGEEQRLTMAALSTGELAPLPSPYPLALRRLLAGRMCLLRVSGSSADPVALDGQFLLVAEASPDDVLDNSLCCVELESAQGTREVVKRFTRAQQDRHRVFLQPINTELYDPIIEAHIEGRAGKAPSEDLPRVRAVRVVWGVLFDEPTTFAASMVDE